MDPPTAAHSQPFVNRWTNALRSSDRALTTNLSRFEDEQYVTRTTEQCRQLEADGTETMKGILRALDAV